MKNNFILINMIQYIPEIIFSCIFVFLVDLFNLSLFGVILLYLPLIILVIINQLILYRVDPQYVEHFNPKYKNYSRNYKIMDTLNQVIFIIWLTSIYIYCPNWYYLIGTGLCYVALSLFNLLWVKRL